MAKKKEQSREYTDKFTGEYLVPVQGWVLEDTHELLLEGAKESRKTLKEFLRHELERVARRYKKI